MKAILTFSLVFIVFSAMPQSVTLDECHRSAKEHYPKLRQFLLNNEVYENNIMNIRRNYYPTLNLNGQVHYQSDVTKVPVLIPEFSPPALANDWYKINLDVEQMIYDGGVTAGQKEVELAKLEISDQQLEVELYQLKEQINQLFFNIVFLHKNIEILEVLHQNLEARAGEAETALENGIILAADVDGLKVELYKTEQQLIEKREDEHAMIASLDELTGLNIENAAQLIIPTLVVDDFEFANNHPEYVLFTKQQQQLVAMKSLTQSKRLPVLKAFGQAGYGRPGYDMLNTDFDDYYMIGARLHWNIWDWGKVKREKHLLGLQNEMIISRKETFDLNLRVDLHQKQAAISKYEKLIQTDEQIVQLQQNVESTAQKQFKNGTVTSTNYLIEVNRLVQSKLNLEAHKLQLIYAKLQYITRTGNL